MTPSVSVIVCTYADDRSALLAAALESVRAQSVVPRETIVVCDHNPDLLQRVRRREAGVRCIPNAGGRWATQCGSTVPPTASTVGRS